MNSSTDINISSGTITITFRSHKQELAGDGICRGLYQVSYDKIGKGRKRISSSVLQGYSQCPISRCTATPLDLSHVSRAIFQAGLTCFRWFFSIVPSGSGRPGSSSAEPDGGVILFESRSTSQMSSGSLKETNTYDMTREVGQKYVLVQSHIHMHAIHTHTQTQVHTVMSIKFYILTNE